MVCKFRNLYVLGNITFNKYMCMCDLLLFKLSYLFKI